MSLEFMSCRGDLKRCRTVFHHVQAFAAVALVHRQKTHANTYIYIYTCIVTYILYIYNQNYTYMLYVLYCLDIYIYTYVFLIVCIYI